MQPTFVLSIKVAGDEYFYGLQYFKGEIELHDMSQFFHG